jgi:RNA polymerase sigma-70 factor (ECF subfamily)
MTDAIAGIPPDLLIRLQAGLRLLALYRLSDADAAQEVVQETLARLLDAESAGRLPELSRIGAYARGIAAHVITDLHRARSRQLPLNGGDGRLVEAGTDPLARLVSQEEIARVRAALQTLPASDRELLRLSYFDGLTPAGLAARLEEPGDRIRKRKQRALERLRLALSPARSHKALDTPTKGGRAATFPLRTGEAE